MRSVNFDVNSALIASRAEAAPSGRLLGPVLCADVVFLEGNLSDGMEEGYKILIGAEEGNLGNRVP